MSSENNDLDFTRKGWGFTDDTAGLNPTLYAVLMDRALEKPIPEWNEGIEMHLRGLASALSRYGEEAMRQAYIAGVRDGFAQGVAAASSPVST